MRRRAAARWVQAVGPVCIAGAGVLLIAGAYSGDTTSARRLAAWALLGLTGVALGWRLVRHALRERKTVGARVKAPRAWTIELSVWLAIATLALVERTGGRTSPLQPLVYLLGAGYALALPAVVSVPLIVALVGLDVALFWARGQLGAHWHELLAQGAFVALFASLYHALLGTRLLRARRAEESAVKRRVQEAEERARELRLIATAEPDASEPPVGPEVRERQVLAAVGELEEALRGALEVARAALGPHSAAVFLLSPDGGHVRLRECVSASEKLFRGPLPSREGALGAVLASGAPVRLCGDGPAISYYQGAAPVAAFLGVPLRERAGHLAEPRTEAAVTMPPDPNERLSDPPWATPVPPQDAGAAMSAQSNAQQPQQATGAMQAGGGATHADPRGEGAIIGALVVDRQLPFSADDERVLSALAAEVARALTAERLLAAVRREKEEKARFFRALEELNRATTAQDAATIATLHAKKICPSLDLCAVSVREEAHEQSEPRPKSGLKRGRKLTQGKRARHHVLAVAGEGSAMLQGLTFGDNAGLVSSVVRHGVAMPARAEGGGERAVIFDGGTVVRGLKGLKIFPLRAGELVVGTLVCGSKRASGLPEPMQRELAMLALQAAEAIVRTRLFETTEKLATTDGLTGLLNRRTLMTQLEARFAEAQRYGRPLSFLLLDVDHFKKVNDTYGHPAGDAVLRGVAAVAAGQARETDLVARYGGEEMALVLPETDAAGARVIAERLRAAIESTAHESEKGELKVTASIGVSTLVRGASYEGIDQLLEAADAALYRAKQSGRNRVEHARGQLAA